MEGSFKGYWLQLSECPFQGTVKVSELRDITHGRTSVGSVVPGIPKIMLNIARIHINSEQFTYGVYLLV